MKNRLPAGGACHGVSLGSEKEGPGKAAGVLSSVAPRLEELTRNNADRNAQRQGLARLAAGGFTGCGRFGR